MRRMFWLAVGLGAGVTVAIMTTRWVQRQRQTYSPANIARQAGMVARDLGALAGNAVRDLRAGMAEREAQIRASLPE